MVVRSPANQTDEADYDTAKVDRKKRFTIKQLIAISI